MTLTRHAMSEHERARNPRLSVATSWQQPPLQTRPISPQNPHKVEDSDASGLI
jgi:hypothetical protein